MTLTMQIVKGKTKGELKCEGCGLSIEPGSNTIGHWDIVENSLDTNFASVQVYPYHESCFYRKVEVFRRFFNEGKIDYLEFQHSMVMQISNIFKKFPIHIAEKLIARL